MGVGTKALKKRIVSVKNTKKMTKAMEMVSAAKMRKSVLGAQQTRLFTGLTRSIVSHLSEKDGVVHPLLEDKKEGKTLLVLLTSNRGLCGSYNSNIFKETKKAITELSSQDCDIIGVGKKSALFCKRYGYNLVGVHEEFGDKPSFENLTPIARQCMNSFISGSYTKVLVAYTDFYSPVVQQALVRQLLPLTKDAFASLLGREEKNENNVDMDQFIFEPSFEEILNEAVPRLVEVLLYQMALESSASEHSSRMVAMKNATDNASALIDDMTLLYNKARQAAITQEISEIVGGAAALS